MLAEDRVLVNMTRAEGDMADERDQTRVECLLREDAFHLAEAPGRTSRPSGTRASSHRAPDRRTRDRHIRGVHVLTGREYAAAERFPDAGRPRAHPIDPPRRLRQRQKCEFLKEAAYIPPAR